MLSYSHSLVYVLLACLVVVVVRLINNIAANKWRGCRCRQHCEHEVYLPVDAMECAGMLLDIALGFPLDVSMAEGSFAVVVACRAPRPAPTVPLPPSRALQSVPSPIPPALPALSARL